MKVILVNKYNYVTGGVDSQYFTTRDLLKGNGNEVAEFCMNCSENLYSGFKDYFVFGLTSRDWQSASKFKAAKEFVYCIYNFEAKKKFEALVDSFNPDIIHLQNIFYQISPSILSVAKKKKIPVIETLQDYHLVCANNNFYHHGKICEDCLKRSPISIIMNKCYNESYKASLLAFASFMFRKMFRIYENRINCWISPSSFLRDKMVRCGIDPKKIQILPNCVQPCELDIFDQESGCNPNNNHKNFVLFIGRFEKQKGIWTLVKAAEELSELKFVFAGDGSVRKDIAEYIRLKKIKNIDLPGFVSPEGIKELIRSSCFVVVPSEWYEVCSLVILEAFKFAKPVIASRIGGIPDMISRDVGLLFEPGNVFQLIENIKELYYNREHRKRLALKTKEKIHTIYSSKEHYLKLMSIYEDVLKSNGKCQ